MATITRSARRLIRGSLRLIGVGGQGEDLDAAQENDAFEIMNEMLASWGGSSSMIQAVVQESFTFAAGTSEYTIGSGQTWDTDRPNAILGGFIRAGSGSDYPLVPMARERFDEIYNKTNGNRPERFYYRPTYPYGKVIFDSAPTSAETVYLDLEKPLASVSTLDATISLPPEYALAIRYNLAILLAPEYERSVKPEVVQTAKDSYKIIERRNTANDPVMMEVDSILTPRRRYHQDFETI